MQVGTERIKFRLSNHPANGDRFANDNSDRRVSIVVYKDGMHKGSGAYTEYVY